MVDLKIKRSLWAHSQGLTNGELFDGEKYCVLGHLGLSVGIKAQDMLHRGSPAELSDDLFKLFPSWLRKSKFLSHLGCEIYDINDDSEESLEIKEKKLQDIFRSKKINLIFED